MLFIKHESLDSCAYFFSASSLDTEDGCFEINVVQLHNGVLHSKKKWHLENYRQMDGSRKHHNEWGNSERQIYLYSLISGF